MHLAFTDYLSRNPSALPQTDDVYHEEYVISNILLYYKFISKYGCLSNHANQSETGTTKSERKTNNEPRSRETREQTVIDCLNNLPSTRKTHSQNSLNPKITMDARTIDNLEATDSSPETTELILRWRDIVMPGIYRLTGGGEVKWKKHKIPKFLRSERKVIERLQQIMQGPQQGDLRQRIGLQHSGGFQPQTRRSEHWTVDPFWDVDRPTPVQQQQHDQSQHDRPGPSSATTDTQHQFAQIPMEEGQIDSEKDQDPSILEVLAWNWGRYVGVKSVQYVKMGHAPKVAALDENN